MDVSGLQANQALRDKCWQPALATGVGNRGDGGGGKAVAGAVRPRNGAIRSLFKLRR